MSRAEPFRLLLADPPWHHGDQLPGKKRGASKHYPTMPTEEICRFPLPPLADDALLLLWRVSSMLEDSLEVVDAWGFRPKSEIVWVKTTKNGKLHFGMGRYVRGSHESILVAARGRASAERPDRGVPSVFFAPTGEHSEKPDEQYRIAERLSFGPHAELFARCARPGWAQYGLDLIGSPAAPGRARHR